MSSAFSCVPGIAWPGLPTAEGAAMLALQWQLEQSQWWSGESLLLHQFRQLRLVAGHAVANVPYYREHLRGCGLASIGEITPHSFLRWPVLRRSDIQERQAALRARHCPGSHGPVSEVFTSGSTAMPMRVLYSGAAQLFANAISVRDHLWHGRDLSGKLGAIRWMTPSGRQSGWSPATNAAFATGPAAAIEVSTAVDSQLEWLLAERPSYLLTTPSNLRALLAQSIASDARPAGLKGVMTYSEALPGGLRQAVQSAWNAPLADTYSCTEFGALALQCPESPHYHLQSENAYVEVLREDGSPCEAGETGRVVVTGLHNFAMPLLRYELGDMAQLGGACGCGRGLPVIRRILGRVRNMARDPQGRLFQPAFDPAIEQTGLPVRQYQFVQVAPAALELAYVMDREMTEGEHAALNEAVSRQMGYAVSLAVQRVDAVPRSAGGKFEGFVSRIAEQPQ
ncbi:MAG: phenylacetate--CoA ligase family protein [Burkholderiales bacterium]